VAGYVKAYHLDKNPAVYQKSGRKFTKQ